MDGPQHYREAERLLQASTTDPAWAPVLVAQAQVHALLALAATEIGTEALAAEKPPGNANTGWDDYNAREARRAAEEEERAKRIQAFGADLEDGGWQDAKES